MARRRPDPGGPDRGRKRKPPKGKPQPGPFPQPPQGETTTTERLKGKSKQTGQESMGAAPGQYPVDPANAQAVFTTGPGQAVEYNYVRVDGGNEQYALQQSEQSAPVPPIAGYGQTVTSGAANNPT